MGYLPPGADERRLHHLESRFAPVARHLIGTYAGQRVPLAPCQEAVARWFGHPHWHAVVARQARAASRWPAGPADAGPSPDEQAWLHEVPLKTLKSLAAALQTQLNLYRDHDRGPSMRWTDARTFDLMARVAGFQRGLEMNQAWAARQPGNRARASWWTRLKDVLRPTPPDGPWTWARDRMDLPTSVTHPDPTTMRPPEPMVRALGQDLDSGWWMGMTSDQARTHTLLLGAPGTGRDTVLAGWVTDAVRQGQSVVWFTAHDVERSEQVERLFNEQARLCLRHQERMTLNLAPNPGVPGSRPVCVNLLDTFSAGAITEMIVTALDDQDGIGNMWKGRTISLVAAVAMVLVWERDRQNTPLSLARLREAFDLMALHQRSENPEVPPSIRAALGAYLRALPGYSSIDHLRDTAREQHRWLTSRVLPVLDVLQPFEAQLFNTTALHRERWSDLCLSAAMRTAGDPEHRLLLVNCGDRCPPVVQRLLLAAVRVALATRLGESLDGDVASLLARARPTTPALMVFDNLPLSRLPGLAVLPAQTRASNMAIVQAMDELSALAEACPDPSHWATFLGNVLTHVLMRQPSVTRLKDHWSLFAPGERIHVTGNGPVARTVEPVAPPTPESLLHYAIGEALVLYRGQAWHVGLSPNLLPAST